MAAVEEKEYTDFLKKAKEISTGLVLKQYLYSFLVWMYTQNSEYKNYVTAEEVTNYFIHNIKHPLWLKLVEENLIDSFTFIVSVNDWITKYFGENIFDYMFTITPKDTDSVYIPVSVQSSKKVCKKAKEQIQKLANILNEKISEDELEKMTLLDAEVTLNVLLRVQSKKKKGQD